MEAGNIFLSSAFFLCSITGISQNTVPSGISENDFIADFRSNLAISERDFRKLPVDTLVLDIVLSIDESGYVTTAKLEKGRYHFSEIVEKSLHNLPVFKLLDEKGPYQYHFKLQYPNPYFGDGIVSEPRYLLKGGVNKLYDEFANHMDEYFRLENIGDFTLVYFVEENGVVKDFVYEEPVSKALRNYTKRFFKNIKNFEPAYKNGVPIRYKMTFTFSIIDN